MKNEKREKSEEKNSGTNKNPEPNRETIEQSPSHKEVKVLLAVVAGILILLIGGSVFLNAQGSDGDREEAIEEALLNNKSKMFREYDPILVNAVEIHDYQETHQSRGYNHIAVEISVPNLQEVYDYYFDQMIKQEVWLKADPQSSIQEIYRQAVEQAKKSVYPIEEQLLLKEEEGQWQVKNPEVLYLLLPYNPTEEIAKDFENVLEEMEASPDFSEFDRDPVLDDVMTILLEEGFFNEISFDWHRDQEGKNYGIRANFHDVMKIQEIGSLDDFRHRREEIVDRQSLVEVIIGEVKETMKNQRDLRTFELREYDQQSKDKWGYRLISRGGNMQYFQALMENIHIFPHMARMSFSHLENYYKTAQVTAENPWPKSLITFEHQNNQVVARNNDGEGRRKLILEGEELWYRMYDPISLEVVEEIIIHEEIQQEDVVNDYLNPYSRNNIKRREGYDLVIFGENGEHIYRVDWESELRVRKLTPDVGNFHQEEIFYLANRPYHMGEFGDGKDHKLKIIQLTDMEKDQVLIEKSYEQLSDHNATVWGNYFVSEAHDILVVYYQGPEELVEEKLSGNSLQIYRGTEAGLEIDDTLSEAFRKVGVVKNFMIMDQHRIFLVNHQNEQWILDLENNLLISVEPGLYEKEVVGEVTSGTREEGEMREGPEGEVYVALEEQYYRFTPLTDNLFFAELFIHSNTSDDVFRREIWKVEEKVTRKMLFQEGDGGYSLTYSLEDQVFISMKENQELWVLEADPEVLENLSGESNKITIEDLSDHEAFTLLDRYQDVNEGMELGYLMIFGQHIFYSPNHKFYSPLNNNHSNPFRYDRDTGNLYYFIRGSDPYMRVVFRESDHQPLLPLWDYQEVNIDQDFKTLYYRDHEGAKNYDLEAFLESLKTVSIKDREDRGTE